jgi:hypothetical protein
LLPKTCRAFSILTGHSHPNAQWHRTDMDSEIVSKEAYRSTAYQEILITLLPKGASRRFLVG